MRADLILRTKQAEGKDSDRLNVSLALQHWLRNPDFNGVRGPDALAKLPEAERKDWQKLWDDVPDTLARAKAKGTAPPPKIAPAEAQK